jgi:hypothetical protein
MGTIKPQPNAAIRSIRSTTVIPTSVVDHRPTFISGERQLVIERVALQNLARRYANAQLALRFNVTRLRFGQKRSGIRARKPPRYSSSGSSPSAASAAKSQ